MDTSISLIGVLVAALSAFVVGGLWYSKTLFLNQWLGITGTSEDELKQNFAKGMVYNLVSALLTAYVLAHFISYTQQISGASGISAGLETAFWTWLGLSLTTVMTSGAMESRSPMLMVIQAGNRLVTLLVMGLIIGAFM